MKDMLKGKRRKKRMLHLWVLMEELSALLKDILRDEGN
jgi:hypothetical protein